LGIIDWILGRKEEERRRERVSIPLTRINGIGQKREEQLMDAGISDVEALAEADLERLAAEIGLSETRLARWQNQAKSLIE